MNFVFYKKPFITSSIFFVLSILMMFIGWTRAESENEMGYFALFAGGIFFAIIALVTFFMYLGLEMKLKRLLTKDGILLHYLVSPSLLKETIDQKGTELKTVNKGLLFIIIGFCVLFAIFAPMIIDGNDDDQMLFRFICIGIGVFMTLAYLIVTAYRIRKLKKANGRIVLSRGAALVLGEFHCWDLPLYRLQSSEFYQAGTYEGMTSAVLKVVYGTITTTGPTSYDILIPVPPEQYQNAVNANMALNVNIKI